MGTLAGSETEMQKLSLVALAREHLARARQSTAGRSAQSVYGGHEHALRQTLVALSEGSTLAEHSAPDEATLQVVQGRVVLRSGDDSWEGRDGDLIIIPDSRHDLHAIEDAVVLLTTVTVQRQTG